MTASAGAVDKAAVSSPSAREVSGGGSPQLKKALEPFTSAILMDELVALGQSGLEHKLEQRLVVESGVITRFWNAAMRRSRFQTQESTPKFLMLALAYPDTVEARAAVLLAGFDLAADTRTAIFYYNSFSELARSHPEQPLFSWMLGVMARTLTRDEGSLPLALRLRVLAQGAADYQTFINYLPKDKVPTLVHQTLANLLEDMDDYNAALPHRLAAYKQEPAPWSAHTLGLARAWLGDTEEGIARMKEAQTARPDLSEYTYSHGYILWKAGRRNEAIDAWLPLVKDDSVDAGRFEFFARCALQADRPWEAIRFAESGLKVGANNKRLEILRARARVLAGLPSWEDVLSAGTFAWNGVILENYTGDDPWKRALSSGDLEKVRELIGSRNLNERTGKYKQTALMAAASEGWTTLVDEFILRGAELDLVDVNGDTALHYAAQFGHANCVKRLLEAGANVNLKDRWQQTPLTMAAGMSDFVGQQVLIEHPGTDVNLASNHGGSALHYAAGFGQVPMLQILLRRGANINFSRMDDGITPLMNAVICRQVEAFNLLLAEGADVRPRDKSGRTLLHHAINPLLSEVMVRAALKAGADPFELDNNNLSPYQLACWHGHMAAVRAMQAGRGSDFGLPALPLWTLGQTKSLDSINAERIALPVFLALGDLNTRIPGGKPPSPKAATDALYFHYGVTTKEAFFTVLKNSDQFMPAHEQASLQNGGAKLLTEMVESITHPKAANGLISSALAWEKSQRLYLIGLGETAGWLNAEQAGAMRRDEIKVVKTAFKSWDDFAHSFLLGAAWHAKWDYERYENLFTQLRRPEAAHLWSADFWTAEPIAKN